jgi:hypothetical protein
MHTRDLCVTATLTIMYVCGFRGNRPDGSKHQMIWLLVNATLLPHLPCVAYNVHLVFSQLMGVEAFLAHHHAGDVGKFCRTYVA